MNSRLCNKLGIEFPLFAFSHCRDVVAAVTNAGGFGVLGAVGHTPESLEIELKWLDDSVRGRPYGVDLLVPATMDGKEGGLSADEVMARIPPEHLAHVESLLRDHGLEVNDLWDETDVMGWGDNMREAGAVPVLDVAFSHPIGMIVNALGPPPPAMMERARHFGVTVGALAGTWEHAVRHAEIGVDVVICAGTEAGGHTGEISTLVNLTETLMALEDDFSDVSVLAAGGIATGRQMAACMAMGAEGAWTGSVWLTTAEAETTSTVKEKMLAAGSRDTVRSRGRTGKPTRQLRSAWTDAWAREDAPKPLAMPLQGLLSRPAFAKIDRLAANGHEGAKELASYYVGQAVGLMNQEMSVRNVVETFKVDYVNAVERLSSSLEE
jgi:NAD(P)H-dependent flavin oxidoreductase YrpB (nitropropane dioxygenase family)